MEGEERAQHVGVKIHNSCQKKSQTFKSTQMNTLSCPVLEIKNKMSQDYGGVVKVHEL